MFKIGDKVAYKTFTGTFLSARVEFISKDLVTIGIRFDIPEFGGEWVDKHVVFPISEPNDIMKDLCSK